MTKRIFVTGSSDGLGLAAARSLIDDGHAVVVHARDDRRADDLRGRLPRADGVLVADLASRKETLRLAAQADELGPFDAVIHNAGVGYRERRRIKTPEGHAHVLAINVLAPYSMAARMQRPRRLIFLSSGMHLDGDASLRDVDWVDRRWNGMQAYSDSKLFDTALALALARRWPDVIVNAVSPGWVATKMGGPGAPDDLALGHITQAWLAVSDDPDARASGRLVHHQREIAPAAAARDPRFQDALIDTLGELTGLRLPDERAGQASPTRGSSPTRSPGDRHPAQHMASLGREREPDPHDEGARPMFDDHGRRPPAYSITEVEVLNEEAAARYAQITGPAVARYGGCFLVLAAEPTVAEGESPADQRIVVIEFPDMHRLEEWYESPEYAPARELARTALRRRLRFVEGVTGVTGVTRAAATTEDAAVATVRRFYEAMNTGDVSAAEEILVPDWEDIPLLPGTSRGVEGFKETVASLRGVFADMSVTIEDVVVSGDRVAVRSVVTGTHQADFLGTAPTGREVEFRAFDFHRLQDGRIAQSWHLEDLFAVVAQLQDSVEV